MVLSGVFTGRRLHLFWCFTLVVFISAPLSVSAHKLSVFAWVEGNTVKVEGKLPKGKRPKQGVIFVYDGKDRLILRKQVQPDGTATFPLQSWETGLKIVMDIGKGHQSYWILTPLDIQKQLEDTEKVKSHEKGARK
jgi:nickel transport protein